MNQKFSDTYTRGLQLQIMKLVLELKSERITSKWLRRYVAGLLLLSFGLSVWLAVKV